ncbi:MAG: hypothetical protein M3Q39_06295 [Actinomycetota bacterium]|nr:hypothetical protein [Actinomycetota bacterium]
MRNLADRIRDAEQAHEDLVNAVREVERERKHRFECECGWRFRALAAEKRLDEQVTLEPLMDYERLTAERDHWRDMARGIENKLKAEVAARCEKAEKERGELSGCAKRGCCEVLTPWQSFGVGCPTRKVYCLRHIPLYYRLKVARQERRND